ncbi:ABC transporter permease [Salibacteraceae bacterium]|nr:ABC transporter permease [Salibacteraceae bacterium]MDB9709330.1 ABC transporter permease [Salibacteraceae bacterium]
MATKHMVKMHKNDYWDLVIEPRSSWLSINLRELYNYKDLVALFVRRDFVSQYKQTLLGPIWFFIQPVFTTLIFTVIFGRVAGIATDGIPQPIFYMSGIVIWNYFADCLTKSSETFQLNQTLFGKVYFPRLIVPLSVVISNLIKLGVQVILLFGFILYYIFNGHQLLNAYLVLFPFYIIVIAFLGLGLGLIISSMTTKYRDLRFLIQFGVQLAMYGTPIVYPLSIISESNRFWILLNPVSSVVEGFRFTLFGSGFISLKWTLYSLIVSIIVLFFGVVVFNRVERSFIDTI